MIPPGLREFPGFPAGSTRPLMRAEGRGTSGVMVVGEALGEAEERDQLPFRPYAEAGSILERALYRAGVSRDSLTLTNLVWYRPPRNWLDGAPWQEAAIAACKGFNDQLVQERAPRAILALGGMAFRELTGLSGEKCGIGMTRGFIVPSVQYRGIPVVGSYHPSFLRRGSKERQEAGPRGKVDAAGGGTQGMSLLGVLIRDILLAVDTARDGARPFVPKPHIAGASLEDWRDALERIKSHPEYPVYYDFETLDSIVASDESEFEITRRDVTQVQICVGGRALISDWFPELLPVFREIMHSPNTKVDWNGRKFDRPILRDMQIRADLGAWEDCMDFWHHAQPDLARGLQFAGSFYCPEVGPWKHLSAADPHWYGLLDVDVLERIHAGLTQTLALTRHPISGISMLAGYSDQVVRLAPVLDRMTARGIPVDEEKRLALDAEFTVTLERILGECQDLVPEELKNVSPKLGYVRVPEELLVSCPTCKGDRQGRVLAEVVGKNGKTRMKKVACPGCNGVRNFLADPIPDGWCSREFTVEVKCGCEWSKPGRKTPKTKSSMQAVVESIVPDWKQLSNAVEERLGEIFACSSCGNTGKVTETVRRWARIEPFLPGSWQQVLRYIEHRRDADIQDRMEGYVKRHPTLGSLAREWAREKSPWKVPMDHKTGRPTTAADELERLAKRTEDPLLPRILEHREIDKARGTYVRGWAGTIGPDGISRVHPGFTFKPSTGQLSSEGPNAQNFIAHGGLAKKMKEMLVTQYSAEREQCV